MKFKSSKAKVSFNEGVKAQEGEAYGLRVFSYAEDWAEMMEKEMSSGAKLEECAQETSHRADTDGITGFMYGAAVSILAQCWKHGEELRQWHNLDTQIGDEGENANRSGGVLNPARLNVSVGA